jgi:lipopolysaccharide export system protein LptA
MKGFSFVFSRAIVPVLTAGMGVLLAVSLFAQTPTTPRQSPRASSSRGTVPARSTNATGTARPAPAAAAGAAQQELRYGARLVRYEPDRPEGTLVRLSGNAWCRFEGTMLKTDAAVLNQTTQVATSPGALQIDDASNTITADKGTALYKKRRFDLSGNVRIVARPRPEDRQAPQNSLRREFKDPVTITCERVEHYWRRRFSIATGSLTLKQKERTVTAERAEYDQRAETVTLIGNVRGVNKGDEIRGARVVIGLKEGQEYLEVHGGGAQNAVTGVIRIEEEDENTPGEEEARPTPPTTPAVPARTPSPASPPAGTPSPATEPRAQPSSRP